MSRSASSSGRPGRLGFTLAEVMLAACIITMAMLAVISVNAYTLRATRGNHDRQIANSLATTELSTVETILKINFRAPSSDINTPRMTSKKFPKFDFVVQDLGFQDTGEDLRAVRVDVFWKENGIEQRYELETTFYNY